MGAPAHAGARRWPGRSCARIYRDADAVVAYGPHVASFARAAAARGASRSRRRPSTARSGRRPATPHAARRGRSPPCSSGRDAPEKGARRAPATRGAGACRAASAVRAHRVDGIRATSAARRASVRNFYAGADVLVIPSRRARAPSASPGGSSPTRPCTQATPSSPPTQVGAAAGGLVRHGRNGLVVPAGDARRARRRPAACCATTRTLRGARSRPAAREDVAPYTFEAWADGFAAGAGAARVKPLLRCDSPRRRPAPVPASLAPGPPGHHHRLLVLAPAAPALARDARRARRDCADDEALSKHVHAEGVPRRAQPSSRPTARSTPTARRDPPRPARAGRRADKGGRRHDGRRPRRWRVAAAAAPAAAPAALERAPAPAATPAPATRGQRPLAARTGRGAALALDEARTGGGPGIQGRPARWCRPVSSARHDLTGAVLVLSASITGRRARRLGAGALVTCPAPAAPVLRRARSAGGCVPAAGAPRADRRSPSARSSRAVAVEADGGLLLGAAHGGTRSASTSSRRASVAAGAVVAGGAHAAPVGAPSALGAASPCSRSSPRCRSTWAVNPSDAWIDANRRLALLRRLRRVGSRSRASRRGAGPRSSGAITLGAVARSAATRC